MNSEAPNNPDEVSLEVTPARKRAGVPASDLLTRMKLLAPAEAKVALEELRQLASASGDVSELLDRLAKSLRESGYTAEMMAVISESLDLPNANPHLGVLWMRRIVESKS